MRAIFCNGEFKKETALRRVSYGQNWETCGMLLSMLAGGMVDRRSSNEHKENPYVVGEMIIVE